MNQRPSVWRVSVETHWRWLSPAVLMAVVAAFAVPILSVRTASAMEIRNFLARMQEWSVAYAFLAAGTGLMLAIMIWSADHRGRHVYALSLPMARWRFVLLRLACGALFLLLPVIALFISAEIAGHRSLIPAGLHVYALSLTLRFAFAALLAFILFFAICSATPRTAAYVLGVVAAVVVAQILLSAVGSHLSPIGYLGDVLFAAPGILAVFGGRWMLIDV